MKNYTDLFAELIKNLRSNKFVKISNVETDFDQLKPHKLAYFDFNLKNAHGFSLTDEKKKLLNPFNYVRAYWFYDIDGKFKGAGDFNIENAYRCISSPVPVKLWTDDTPEDDLEILKRFRIVVNSPDAGDNKIIGFNIEQSRYTEDLWFYNRGHLYKMQLDFEGLLEALLKTKGIGNWEYFYCDFDPSFTLDKEVPQKLRSDLEALKELFPETDYSDLEEKVRKFGV